MTVCIAALCGGAEPQIVSVSDTKISFAGDYSADDLVVKIQPLIENWWVLISGDDITGIPFVLATAREKLTDQPIRDEFTVPRAVHMGYVDRLRQEIEAQVLDRYDLTLKQFRSEGTTTLSTDLYAELSAKISKVRLSLQLMVVGFDSKGKGHLVMVDGESAPAVYDEVGFCVIGSGSNPALNSLLFHADGQHLHVASSVGTCIYCCCEPKFRAESASDVGHSTFVSVLRYGRPQQFIASPRVDEELRNEWLKYGPSPGKVIKQIPDMLFSSHDLGLPDGLDRVFGKPKKRDRTSRRLTGSMKALIRSMELSPASTSWQPDRRPSKADPKSPQPSPESPVEKHES